MGWGEDAVGPRLPHHHYHYLSPSLPLPLRLLRCRSLLLSPSSPYIGVMYFSDPGMETEPPKWCFAITPGLFRLHQSISFAWRSSAH